MDKMIMRDEFGPPYETIDIQPPNWSVTFGDQVNTLVFNLYVDRPPNRFQRWMLRKFFSMYWKPAETKGS